MHQRATNAAILFAQHFRILTIKHLISILPVAFVYKSLQHCLFSVVQRPPPLCPSSRARSTVVRPIINRRTGAVDCSVDPASIVALFAASVCPSESSRVESSATGRTRSSTAEEADYIMDATWRFWKRCPAIALIKSGYV